MPEEEDQDQGQGEVIVTPHDHDVLSGRGNFVNYHKGNEHFRALVRKHKVAYVACPKAQKGKFSKLIVDEIKALDPPGRFLKQDPATKLWSDIGEKKALDKTRQALREGAPEIMKELNDDDSTGDDKARDAATSPQNGPRSLTRVPINMVSPQAPSRSLQFQQPGPGMVAGPGYSPAPANPYLKSPGGMYEAAARMSQMHRADPGGMGLGPQQQQSFQASAAPPSPYHLPQHVGNIGGMMPLPQRMESPLRQAQALPVLQHMESPVRQHQRMESPLRHSTQLPTFHPGSAVMDQQIQDHLQQQKQQQHQIQATPPPPISHHATGSSVPIRTMGSAPIYPPNHHAMDVNPIAMKAHHSMEAKLSPTKAPPPFLSCFDPRPLPPDLSGVAEVQLQDNSSESDDVSPMPPTPSSSPSRPAAAMGIGNNRKEIKREDSDRSLHADSLFSGLKIPGTGALGTSSHHKNSQSSNQLSAISGMSLSIGDMAADGSVSVDAINSLDSVKSMHVDPLSMRFNNSLRIGSGPGGGGGGLPSAKPKSKKHEGSGKTSADERGNHSELLGHMDMSVATLGASDFDVSAGMSFTNVFED